MKKKLLVVMLALALVLAFSSLAMAASSLPADDFTATAGSGTSIVNGETPNEYVVYTSANSVTLTFTKKDGVELDKTTLTLPNNDGNSGTVKATKADATEVTYKFTYNNASADIDGARLFTSASETTVFGMDGTSFLVPVDVDAVYVKITPPAEGIEYTVEGANSPDANGFAKVVINDFTTEFTVAVKIGGVSFASKTFELLRPTLQYVDFNKGAVNSGRNRMEIENGVYTYKTDDGYVESDWSTVYIRPQALCHDATVTVKRSDTPLSKSGDWYYQRMSSDVYKLTVTVSVGKTNTISKPYTIYLMAEDYVGPTVKTFAANESNTGLGANYLTVIDNVNRKLYVFLPEGKSSFYARVTMNGGAEDLKLNSTGIYEANWAAASTATSKLTFKDGAGLEYEYAVNVIKGSKNYNDASLKSLTVKSGSRQNTASDVDINFDPKVTEYAFSVAEKDVWLRIAAAAKDSKAKVFINNQELTSLTVKDLDTAAESIFEILVVAGDGVTTETYTVTVNGSTGLLQSLSASNVVGLTPAFDADVNTYTTYTAAGINSTYIVAIAKNYSSDYIQISQANFNEYGQVKSYSSLTRAVAGGTSCTGELKTGANIFRVDVLPSANASSAKASYYLTIYVPAANPKCVVSSQKLYVNGKAQTLSAYNIAGNNYLKLRDVAALLDGTVKEMNVDWDASKWTASMVMPGTFVRSGGELIDLTPPKKYELSTQYFTYNAKPVFPLAYNVTGTGDAAGYNYVMLRDVASLLDFGVTYNPTSQTVNIDTASEYTPGL